MRGLTGRDDVSARKTLSLQLKLLVCDKTVASSMKPRQFVMFLLIVLTLTVVNSEARLVPGQFSAIGKMINSKFSLREVINNVRSGKWHGKRSMLAGGGRLQRVSPAGPDPDHH
ncbi:hypothetical protein VNO78_06526 [Psophocarpus tetragonolobus]|uniref:Uncharacterized protein n=1 Tax=Psophocarpus tetragonolobus TaxID=3891 RepID=A0AAN9SSK9_PSOTE